MSVILKSEEGYVVCHHKYLQDLYDAVYKNEDVTRFAPHQHLFLLKTPYMKDDEARKKVKETSTSYSYKRKFSQISSEGLKDLQVTRIQHVYKQLLQEAHNLGYFTYTPSSNDIISNNKDAREVSDTLYRESSDWISPPFSGGNNTSKACLQPVGAQQFLFPPNCKFFCKDVHEIKNNLESLGEFDLILLDPPWWNKYIRRKKAKCLQQGYKMMYNDCLGELPLNQMLAPGGIIAVWCTNSNSHLEELKNKLLPLWGTKSTAQWTWMKVTQSGMPVCAFSEPPGKQPFEQLIFGVRPEEEGLLPRPQDGKVFLSVPSAIHSHKPPISDLMKPFLPEAPRCLEIFARYLVPNWTSWGLEVIKLQHVSLFHVPEDQHKKSM